MKTLKRLDLLLLFTCILFCFVIKTNASPVRYIDISKRPGNDTSITDSYRTTNLETSTTQHVPTSVSTPIWTSKVQHREPGVIKLYSRDWWMAVYGSVNGIKNHMIVLGTFLIAIGLFLCTMGFRQWKPMLAVMGLLTFGLLGWIALANCRPENGYPNDTIVMIVVPISIGFVGAIIYFVFWNFAFYLAGALGGLALAIFICSWKYNFVIENLIGRSSFLSGMAVVFAIGTYFVLKYFLIFSTSFVGAYITFLGIDCLARKGYIAGIEGILNGNDHSRIEYAVSTIVYVFLAMTLVFFFASFGWQTHFNVNFILNPVADKMGDPSKAESVKKEAPQSEGGGEEGGEVGGGEETGEQQEEAGEQQEEVTSSATTRSIVPTQPNSPSAPSVHTSFNPPPPPPGTATTIHTTSARFTISPD